MAAKRRHETSPYLSNAQKAAVRRWSAGMQAIEPERTFPGSDTPSASGARRKPEYRFPLLTLSLLWRSGRKGEREPYVPAFCAVLRRELPVGFHIGDALDLVGDGKEIIELGADPGDSGFEWSERRAEAAVASDLLEKVADGANIELLRQEVGRAGVEMEVEAVLVAGVGFSKL
jgi:hypothetical protein